MTTTSGRPALALAAAATALALGLTACGSTTEPEAAPAQSPAEDTAAPESGDTSSGVPAALAFDTTTVDGADFSGASLAGEPAVLWFWAPWCTVCRAEAASVVDASERHDVEFIGVAGLGEVDAMSGFVSDTGTGGLTHLVDGDGSLWSGFGVASQPAFAFLSADGTFETVQGTLTDEELDSRVTAVTDGA
ncbi:redoxin domain-containing protein [Nocardiopsis sp. CNT312]|uniref:redoxin domain-containing protein n=1 Tax=Nocardiopsis sp. CNT312 TaxID=1137268 RepID=UPI0004BC8798|nr:redoxin domain-containing protein [Nocardiopsis sp. CNT312]